MLSRLCSCWEPKWILQKAAKLTRHKLRYWSFAGPLQRPPTHDLSDVGSQRESKTCRSVRPRPALFVRAVHVPGEQAEPAAEQISSCADHLDDQEARKRAPEAGARLTGGQRWLGLLLLISASCVQPWDSLRDSTRFQKSSSWNSKVSKVIFSLSTNLIKTEKSYIDWRNINCMATTSI